MEAELMDIHEMMKDLTDRAGVTVSLEVKILRVHVDDSLRLPGHHNRVHVDKWRPIITRFQDLYGQPPKVVPSRLARIKGEIHSVLTRSNVKLQGGDIDIRVTVEEGVVNADEFKHDFDRVSSTNVTVN